MVSFPIAPFSIFIVITSFRLRFLLYGLFDNFSDYRKEKLPNFAGMGNLLQRALMLCSRGTGEQPEAGWASILRAHL